MAPAPRARSELLGDDRLASGVTTLQDLHARFRKLVAGVLRYGPGDDLYARYFPLWALGVYRSLRMHD